jgi:hypothetical protein
MMKPHDARREPSLTLNHMGGPTKRIAMVCALSLLVGGVALIPNVAESAPWISGAESYGAPWMKDVEKELLKKELLKKELLKKELLKKELLKKELLKKEYWMIYANDPRAPQNEVLHLLNRAAKAQETNDPVLAGELVREAFDVLEEGVRRHYYTQSDIEPIMSYLRHHVPIAPKT